MTRPDDAVAAFRAAPDRPDHPAATILWGAAIALWLVLSAVMIWGAVTGTAELWARLLGLDMPAAVLAGVACCLAWSIWTACAVVRGPR